MEVLTNILLWIKKKCETKGMANKHLFGNYIEPACTYCQFGRPAPDRVMVLCRKYGPVSPYFKCKKFVYSPLKRIPKRQPKLPAFSPEDFEI